MKRVYVLSLLGLVAGCASDSGPAPSTATAPARVVHPIDGDGHAIALPDSVSGIMHEKLAYASAVLEGLAIEDFGQIERNARKLSALSRESDWMVHDTASYTVLSRTFRSNLDDLVERARDENGDEVGAAYLQMVGDCMNCHDYLRAEGLWRQLPGAVSRAATGDEPMLPF